MAAVLYERDELESAERCARLSMDLCERSGRNRIEEIAYFYLVQALLARGNTAGAESEMEKTEWAASMSGTFPINRAWHASFRVLYSIRRGDLKAAHEWGNRMSGFLHRLPIYLQLMWCRLLIAEGDQRGAMALLQGMYALAARAEAYGLMIGVLVHQALAAESNEQALTFLSEALELGEPRGYIRTFVDEGRLLKPLLEKAWSRGVTPDYTRKLLDIIETEEHQRQARTAVVTPHSPQGLLSERELEILRLVESGLSNRQIAGRLTISLGTAKTHVHNVFEKLDVKTRTQAISRAKELKLI